MQQRVFGRFGDGQVKLDVENGVIAPLSGQASLHLGQDPVKVVEVGRVAALSGQKQPVQSPESIAPRRRPRGLFRS
jgi:hypothetical protein